MTTSSTPQVKTPWPLYFIAFFSGAALMALEISGARLMDPHFGTSVYVWGSIIGVFLVSLAGGYWLGGLLADKMPKFNALCMILGLAGLLTSLVPVLEQAFFAQFKVSLGTVSGPLWATLTLFLLPCLAYGCVSPWAVRLGAVSLHNVGNVAGRLYAVSTAGSFAGTMLVTFYLINTTYNSYIIVGLGIAVMLLALLAMLWNSGAKGLKDTGVAGTGAAILLAIAFLGAGYASHPPDSTGNHEADRVYRIMEIKDSAYHQITIREQVLYGSNEIRHPYNMNRDMIFNTSWESGIFPYRDQTVNAVSYTNLLPLGILFRDDRALWNKSDHKLRMLVIGGGGGVAPMQFKYAFPGLTIDVIEIDPQVLRMCREYFKCSGDDVVFPATWDDPVTDAQRVRFYNGDGRRFVETRPDACYDYVILDAYSSGGRIPAHLTTREFLQHLHAKMKPDAVLVSNLIGALKPNPIPSLWDHSQIITAEFKTMNEPFGPDKAQIFNQLYVFRKTHYTNSGELESPGDMGTFYSQNSNIMLIAFNSDKPRLEASEIKRRAHELADNADPAKNVIPPVIATRGYSLAGYEWAAVGHWFEGHCQFIDENEDLFLKRAKPVALVDDFCPTDLMTIDSTQ
ncbi:MAG TPA: fused MFS/spermidine synthase [Planctomycetota bacterium]|nr:fused MFS/spermidine synthase [Planctomycetota bacterium]